MIRRLLPFVIALVALIAGAVGGEVLRGPDPAHAPAPAGAPAAAEAAPPASDAGAPPASAPAEGAPAAGEGHDAAAGAAAPSHGTDHAAGSTGSTERSSFRFPQQFFVPMVRDGKVAGMMVLTLSVEMPTEAQEAVFAKENQLRDAILRQLLIHANTGGFDGNFTAEAHLSLLRQELLASARRVAPGVDAVLIGDITRQEG